MDNNTKHAWITICIARHVFEFQGGILFLTVGHPHPYSKNTLGCWTTPYIFASAPASSSIAIKDASGKDNSCIKAVDYLIRDTSSCSVLSLKSSAANAFFTFFSVVL